MILKSTGFLFFFLGSQHLLPLTEHVEVHGGEERDVEQHGNQDEEGEAEAGVESVGEMIAEDIIIVGIEETSPLTEQLSSDSSRVGDDEESVSENVDIIIRKHEVVTIPEPGEEVGRAGDEVDGVHGVSDDLRDGPGEQQHGEPQ